MVEAPGFEKMVNVLQSWDIEVVNLHNREILWLCYLVLVYINYINLPTWGWRVLKQEVLYVHELSDLAHEIVISVTKKVEQVINIPWKCKKG